MKYRVKFELYGKKMQTVVEAKSEEEAKYLIRGKVIFYEVKADREPFDWLKDTFGI